MSLSPAAPAPALVKFELLDEIGHGGMATVYRARDVRLGREVAVKLIHPHLRENKEVAARFIAEARAVAKLRHPSIVEVYDVSDAADTERYLVAELVRGPSLRKLLSEHPEIPPEVGACFGVLLSDALAHAHDAGIVHRDVKPENVLVEVDAAGGVAHVKLTDFGIAKVLDAQSVTSTGQVLGSPAHMAPEQIEGGEVDVRADVFSLGVLIYECMAGRLPFEGKNPAQVLKKVLECQFTPPDKQRPTVGVRWSSILRGAIAREPCERYADIRKFGDALRAELSELGMGEPRDEIYRYLTDPEGYVQRFVPALVASLIGRAQQAQRSRDVPAAAADLNRAVAYRPDDPELLRQVTSLVKGQRRKQTLNKGLWVLSAIVIMAGATPLVARAFKRRPTLPSILPIPVSVDQIPGPSATASPSASERVVHATIPSALSSIRSAPAFPLRLPPVELKERTVLITSTPRSAYVSVDRGQPIEVGQAGITMNLAVGPHIFDFTPPPDGKACCESVTLSLPIEADDGSGRPKQVYGRLKFRAARVTLTNAPAEGTLVCPTRKLSIGNGSTSVPMNSPSDQMACTFNPLGKSELVLLRPGGETVVMWPAKP